MSENAGRIILWCKELNYTAWYLKEKVALISPDHIAHRGRCHLLLQPSDWDFPEFLKDIEQGAALPDTVKYQ